MFTYPKNYGVIVIGAGHAGIEAAMASARIGCETLILTQNLDSIGQMSCNPAIGGQAKGQIVREIDALGGVMGHNADATGIQFRILNASKGPSARAPRAQCDKKAYQFRAKALLEAQLGLDVKQGNVTRIMVGPDGVSGVETDLAVRFHASAVVITTGTFLRALLHVGLESQTGGRMGDGSSTLSSQLKELGFEVGRFKTGTPCRLNGRSIDFTRCVRQDGDQPPRPFTFTPEALLAERNEVFSPNSYSGGLFHVEQLPCWLTHTSPKTHEIIRSNLHQSPLFSGKIEGTGPRYCPSIEDKVVRFAGKDQHQIFLEPEGRQTGEFYVNGVSTSLPMQVQYDFVRSIPALEEAEIMRPGYAVEYDYCAPTQLQHTLETRRVPGLYFAGQLNGTSGYEEAAAQGLLAGANAALKTMGKPEFILPRTSSYIGVLVDDLVSKGTSEPYRMFTSRAEHRLLLREDNADTRLTAIGRTHGLISDFRWQSFTGKADALGKLREMVATTRIEGSTLAQWLRRPENEAASLPAEIRQRCANELWSLVETELKYEGYISRQEQMVQKLKSREEQRIPGEIDYGLITGFRAETRQKLQSSRPQTLGHAARISGVTPADIALLSVYLESAGSRK